MLSRYASAKIVVVGDAAGSGSGVSGLVIQKINVRNGPAATFESLGVLNPNDVVFITGKDPSGAWIQIGCKAGGIRRDYANFKSI